MKTIIYRDIEITNFKGIKYLKVDLNATNNTLLGKNESGKTTFVDAINWVFTGKNSLDEKEFEIKNTVDRSLNAADHSIILNAFVDGANYKFKRVLKENWVTPKMQTTKVLKGNVQEFFINDVPMQAGEYSARIKEILLDEDKLKMLTNPYFFNKLSWQKQREMLNEMAGNPNDELIADMNPEFKQLLSNLKGKTLNGYRGEIKASIALSKKEQADLPGRLDEVKRGMPEMADFDKIESQISEKQKQLSLFDDQINDRSKAYNDANQVINERANKINRLENEIVSIKHNLRQSEQIKINNASLEHNKLKNAVLGLESDIQSKNNLIKSTEEKIKGLTETKDAILLEWQTEHKKVFPGIDEDDCKCATCKQSLPPENIDQLKKDFEVDFNTKKVAKKQSIEKRGFAIKTQIETEQTFLDNLKAQIAPLELQLKEAKEKVAAYVEPAKESVLTELALCKDPAVSQKMNEVDDLKALQPTGDKLPVLDIEDIKSKKIALSAEIDALKVTLSDKAARERAEKRIKEIENDQLSISQTIADLEAIEHTIKLFIKTKVEYVEKLVSGMFEVVTFKMYDYTLEGNPVDTCQAMYKGVPFSSLNTAGKIQAGLDIIKAISRHVDIEAPITLDNRESTTSIPEMPNQLINLFVSPEHEKLTVA